MNYYSTTTISSLRKESSSRRDSLFLILLCFALVTVFISCSGSDTDHPVIPSDTLTAINAADSLLLENLLEQAWNWRPKNVDSSLYYAHKAAQLARNKNYPKAEAQAYCRLANIQEFRGENDSAFNHFMKALSIDSAIGNDKGIAREYYSLANLIKKNGEYEKAKEYTTRAIDIWRTLGDVESLKYLAGAKINLGNIYMRESKVDLALPCFAEADSIGVKTGDLIIQADAMNGFGWAYEAEHSYGKAMTAYQNSLKIQEERKNNLGIAKAYNNIGNIYYLQDSLVQSLVWFEKSLKLKEEMQYTPGVAGTYTNIGSIYEAWGDFQTALSYHLKSYEMQSESGDVQGTAISATNVGSALRGLGREQEALHYFEQALDLAHQSGGKILEMQILGNMAQCASAIGNYSLAFTYSDRQQRIRDTIDSALINADRIDDLYQEEKNNNQLLQKEQEKQQAELQLKNAEAAKQQTLVYALVAGIAMIILLFLALWKISREQHRAVVAEQQEQINRQHTEELIRNQELVVLRSIFDAQQKERQRIATDLHDGLSLKLSTARLYYNLVGKLAAGMNEEERKQYTKGHDILNEASKELREVAHDLVSGKITRFGLVQELEQLCETLQEASGLKIDFYSSGMDDRLDSHSEFQVYQIIQELLANVHRHAKAQHVTVQLSRYNHTLNVLVEDNGQGFSGKISGSDTGIGLKNIRERVQKLNGSFQIDSTPGRGTTVSIDITILSAV